MNFEVVLANFGEKLAYIIQNEIFGREHNSDWKIVDGLIRNLRNYIHLQTYIKDWLKVNKNMFDTLEHILLLSPSLISENCISSIFLSFHSYYFIVLSI